MSINSSRSAATDAGRANLGEDRGATRPTRDESLGDVLWTIDDVSRYLSVPVSSIYKMTARTAVVRIPHIRIGGKVRFRKKDLDRWLALLTVSNLEVLAKMR